MSRKRPLSCSQPYEVLPRGRVRRIWHLQILRECPAGPWRRLQAAARSRTLSLCAAGLERCLRQLVTPRAGGCWETAAATCRQTNAPPLKSRSVDKELSGSLQAKSRWRRGTCDGHNNLLSRWMTFRCQRAEQRLRKRRGVRAVKHKRVVIYSLWFQLQATAVTNDFRVPKAFVPHIKT